MAVDVTVLGARIAQLRELRGLSLGALADAAGGMAKSYLAKLEKGEVENPGLRTLSAIARALGVTVADLLELAEPQRRADGAALLAEESEFQQIMANLPPGLREFLDEMAAEREPVPPEMVRALAAVQVRGRRPERSRDWRWLYDAMIRSTRPS